MSPLPKQSLRRSRAGRKKAGRVRRHQARATYRQRCSSNANSLRAQNRLEIRKSVRPFKGISCDDNSNLICPARQSDLRFVARCQGPLSSSATSATKSAQSRLLEAIRSRWHLREDRYCRKVRRDFALPRAARPRFPRTRRWSTIAHDRTSRGKSDQAICKRMNKLRMCPLDCQRTVIYVRDLSSRS